MVKKCNISNKNPNILIVENSKLVKDSLIYELQKNKFNCFSCSNIKDAKLLLKEEEIEYLILDIDSNDENPYDLINILENSNTKIYVLTYENRRKQKEYLYDRGIIKVTVKDQNFFYKINSLIQSIINLEKNKTKEILIIDDSIVIQEQLKELLNKRNYKVKTSSDTKQAYEIINQEKIDLLILDVELKGANGLEFLKKHHEKLITHLNIPIMIISGNVDMETIRDSLSAGAVEVLRKPLIFEELIMKVDLWIDYKRKEEEIKNSTRLLKQYKDTVDRSSIVIKTTSEGIITYTNDEFCKVSGYKREELIGRSVNIIRHESSPKNYFDKIAELLKRKKKSFKSVLKNSKKDGEIFWTKTIVNPILDHNNNLIEFIAISSDVTNEQNMKKYFENQLNNSTKNLSEAMKLSQEYKRAVNESSIVSRMDLKGNITFVNDEFCKISGFTKEELIGQKNDIVRHPDIKNSIYKELWHTIKQGKTWKGILKNISKDKKTYWVDSTIVPIKNSEGNIIEYMAIRKDLTSLFDLHKEMEYTQKEIIYRMGEIGETRSKETGNHVKRVANYSRLLAKHYGLEENEIKNLYTASPMHDIGKVGIPDEILKKPGKLSDDEMQIMKEHALIGYNILKGSKREVLKAAAIVAKEHHEKWDGSGYPYGLKGEEIHIYGRITAIADVFDALGSNRCYKKAWSDDKIFKLILEEKGKSFDPKLVDVFFRHIDEFLEIRNKYADDIEE